MKAMRCRRAPTARAVTMLTAVLGPAACADDPDRSARVTVVDSAGVAVVTAEPGSLEAVPTWTIDPTPAVEIGGGVDPEVALFRVVDVAPLPAGVAVATNEPPRVLLFGPNGEVRATLGRAGDGPGEFSRDLASVVPLAPDSLAVWDQTRRRLSVFTTDGAFRRELDLSGMVPISPAGSPSTAGPAAWTHLLASGDRSLFLFAVGVFGEGEGVRRPAAESVRISRDGQRLATLGPFPGYASYAGPTVGVGPYPFGPSTYGAVSGGSLVVGFAADPEVRLYGPDGALERIVRWPDHDRRLQGPLVDRWNGWLDDFLGQMPEGEARIFRELLDAVPRPERLPAYQDVLTDDEGRIWVGEYPGQLGLPEIGPEWLRLPERRWLVFDTDGALLATTRTPGGFSLHAVHRGRLWGVFTDELAVESVRAYVVTAGG